MQNREIEYQRGMNPSKRKKYHDQLEKEKKDLEKQRQKEYKMIQAELKKDLKNTSILEYKPIIQNEINENAKKREAEIAELAAEKLAEKKRRKDGERAEKERRRGMTEAQIQDEERRIRASDETRAARELEENRRLVLEVQRQAELQRERERTHRINAYTANAEIIAQREQAPARTGLAFEIHNAFYKIDMDAYMEIMNNEVNDNKIQEYKKDIVDYINLKLTSIIMKLFKGPQLEEKTKQIDTIMLLLKETLVLGDETEEYVSVMQNTLKTLVKKVQLGKSIDYVLNQSNDFIEFYINTFLQDSLHAYEGEHGVSCIPGIVERIIMLIGDALFMECKTTETKCSPNQIKLLNLFGMNKIDINELMMNWFKEWEEDTSWKNMTPEERKDNLTNYLRSAYDKAGYSKENYEPLIKNKVEELSYIFTNIEDDIPTFGGGRRKRVNKKNIAKTRKIIKKSKKQNKQKKSKKQKHVN
jgi:hypothetical protein